MANTTADLIVPKIASNQTEVVVIEDVSRVEVMVVVCVDTVDDGTSLHSTIFSENCGQYYALSTNRFQVE